MENRFKLIFDCVWQEVAASCGDGDGIVVFHQTSIKHAAFQFEDWMKEHPTLSKWPLYRHDVSDKHILFSDNSNENISFYAKDVAPNPTKLPWNPEIYMEIW